MLLGTPSAAGALVTAPSRVTPSRVAPSLRMRAAASLLLLGTLPAGALVTPSLWAHQSEVVLRRRAIRCCAAAPPLAAVSVVVPVLRGPVAAEHNDSRVVVDSLKTAGSVTLVIGADVALRIVFAHAGVAIPSSLVGMGGLFAALCAAPSGAVDAAYRLCDRGRRWLLHSMAVFYAPSLVVLPLAASSLSARELVRAPLVLVLGWLATTLLTALAMRATPAAAAAARAPTSPLPPVALRQASPMAAILRAAWVAAAAACVALPGPLAPSSRPLQLWLLSSTWLAFRLAQRLPAPLRKLAHPTVLAAAATHGLILAVAAATGLERESLLRAYAAKAAAGWGGGGLLSAALPACVLAFSLNLYERRRELRQQGPRIAAAAAVGVVTGLAATALAARWLRLSPPLAHALLLRCTTAPLAGVGADLVGADPSLAVAAVVVTGVLGANFCCALLRRLGMADAARVGLVMGTSAHGLGTASLAAWPEALSFSAIALAVHGFVSTGLLALPPVRALLAAVIGGAP